MKRLLLTAIFTATFTCLWAGDCKTSRGKKAKRPNASKPISTPQKLPVNKKATTKKPPVIIEQPCEEEATKPELKLDFLYDYGFWWTPVK